MITLKVDFGQCIRRSITSTLFGLLLIILLSNFAHAEEPVQRYRADFANRLYSDLNTAALAGVAFRNEFYTNQYPPCTYAQTVQYTGYWQAQGDCNPNDGTNSSTDPIANIYPVSWCVAANIASTNGVCPTVPAGALVAKNLAVNACVGNPINPGIGNKHQDETDYVGPGPFPLKFVRQYDSKVGRWRFQSWIVATSASTAEAHRDDNRTITFTLSSGQWISDADATETLTRLTDGSGATTGWRLINANDEVETYNANGRLVKTMNRAGLTLTWVYSDGTTGVNGGYLLNANGTPTTTPLPGGYLIRVTDSAGRSLSFAYYTNYRLAKMIDPAGGVHFYQYEAIGNLASVTYPNGSTRQYLYNESAYTSGANLPRALTGLVDENGARYATWYYDSAGNAISSEHGTNMPGGPVDKYTLTYNADGTTTVTDPLNTQRTLSFQTVLGVIKVAGLSQPGGAGCGPAASALSYDGNGNVVSRTDFNGNVTTYQYDLSRNLETARTEAAGTSEQRTITTAWHPTFRLPTQITMPGQVIDNTYDPTTGNLLTRTLTDTASGASRTWTYTYTTGADATLSGLLKSVDGPRTDVTDITLFTYYSNGDLKTITNALNQTTWINQYDAHGRPLSVTDPNGLTTTLTYDARGRLITRTMGYSTTTYTYDGVGQVTEVTLPDGNYMSYTYDTAHRLTDITDALGNRISYTYDRQGNRIREERKDPAGAIKTYLEMQYDALSRLERVTNPDASFTAYGYDPNGNRTGLTDPDGNETSYEYDALNRMSRMTQPGSINTVLTYDAQDHLSSVTDGNGNTTTYEYGDGGRVVTLISPDTGTTQYTYDKAGNMTSKLDANGILVTYTYDALNRLTGIHFPDPNQDITYSYDGATSNGLGRLTGMTDPSGTTTYSYTNKGQLYQEVKTFAGLSGVFTTTYSYDDNSNLTGVTYPSGRQVTYTLDSADRLTQVSGSHGGSPTTYATLSSYLPYGPYQTISLGNGLGTTVTYDNQYRFDGQTIGSSPQLLSNDYSHDANGNVTAIEDLLNSSKNKTFGYDALDRLTTATGPWPSSGSLSYTYDSVGNRLTEGGSLGSSAYTYSDNILTGVTGSKSLTFSYDATGNTVSENNRAFIYNQNNRLIQVTENSATLGAYTYDGQGRRVKKIAGGQTTYFLYDQQSRLIAETDASGNVKTDYLYLPDRPLAKIDIDGSSEEVYYYHTDHLGTPLFITNNSGQKVWSAELLPFGEGFDVNEDVDGDQVHVINNLRFPGQYYDAETGLHYNMMRDYNPQVGRYTQSDPIGLEGGINTFAYVGSSPLNWIDPLGLELLTKEEGALIVKVAVENKWLGTPYRLVGKDTIKGKKGDCSGTTWGIYSEAGFSYEYSRADQIEKNSRFKSVTKPQIGDIGWMPGHIVIYMGNGKFISASSSQGKLVITGWWRGKIQQWYRYDKP